MDDWTTFERGGAQFRVRVVRDDDMREPWIEHDGHGIVSDWTQRPKAPGERVLIEDRGSFRYYDVRATLEIAKRDRWNAPPYAELGSESAKVQAARAVEEDFQRMRAWCRDEWEWVGVIVERLNVEGFAVDRAALWGIESDAGEYLNEVRDELADELIARGVPAVAGA